eukprot:COSAG01_NODE_10522_length_2144_cov_1.611736_2_plen_66_part_00
MQNDDGWSFIDWILYCNYIVFLAVAILKIFLDFMISSGKELKDSGGGAYKLLEQYELDEMRKKKR